MINTINSDKQFENDKSKKTKELDKLIIKQLQEVISNEEINNLLLGDNIVDYFPNKITRSIAIDFVIYHKRELLLYEGEIKNYCSTLPDHKEVTKVWYQAMVSIVITHIQGLLECPAVQKDIAEFIVNSKLLIRLIITTFLGLIILPLAVHIISTF
jgi:hypothetical protein